ncbi:L,D-transpeptidase [Nitratireductor luteus]|uniref:L,D-transpeptidase n=1 Tax=Nitratireductor luteus TaxID=2976980 RepID=UPI00223EE449|nr:L,D-transpeptidase [Nitratireductor luteus]
MQRPIDALPWMRLLSVLALVLGVLTAAPLSHAQGSIQWVSQQKRPPLPSMGPSLRRQVTFATQETPGTILIRKDERALYLVTGRDTALRYDISVGREGFGWTGVVKVGAKKVWPEWRPPTEMRKRQPGLPDYVPAGPYNPLGARALYLHDNGRDTLYRIHGTNDPDGVGFDGTSGCFRLTNTDIVDLYERVSIGAKVMVQ